MIKKLCNDDKDMALAFLGEEAAINLFIIGDIEAFGFDQPYQELWGQYDDKGELEGILLRFHESHIPYFKKSDFDTKGFKELILSYEGDVMMSGKGQIISMFDDILPNHKRRSTYFCEIKEADNLHKGPYEDIKIATLEDSEKIYDCIEEIKEFSSSVNDLKRIQDKFRTNSGRVYYIEEDEKIISLSQTTAENSMAAMVVGVATLENYRGNGLTSRCLSKLCKDVIDEGKSLCLFYDNPDAGKIYHRIGFKTIDNWTMVSKHSDTE